MPEPTPLRLRFRLIPGDSTGRWWLDDVRAEGVVVPSLFAFPFEDDVEGLRYWDGNGAWARTSQQAHNGWWTWQSGQGGDILTLAGDIVVPQGITPTLTFWQMVSPTLEGRVELSTNSGASWTPVYTVTTANSEWSKTQVTLDSAAGLTTTLRFRQQAGPTGGWLIDDLSVDQLVSPTNVISVFLESGGQVVMEAEHFTSNIGSGNRVWLTQTVLSNYAGSGYMSALPDTDLQFTAAYTPTGSELSYTINFTSTGAYYVWLRGYAPNAAGDSLYLGQDGQLVTTLTGFAPREWRWGHATQYGAAVIYITQPGLHTLHLWQREDGLRLDRIVLTSNSSYNPVGEGPSESEIR